MTFAGEPRFDPPFGGMATFLRAPVCADLPTLDADVAIFGIPFDEGTTWKPGLRLVIEFPGRITPAVGTAAPRNAGCQASSAGAVHAVDSQALRPTLAPNTCAG
jgi:hypothetical protein